MDKPLSIWLLTTLRIAVISISSSSIIQFSYAQDTIYQYRDMHGNLVISNIPQNRRGQILAEELGNEKAALKDAENLLAQNAKMPDNQQKIPSNILEEAIAEHKKNIEILTKQLGTYACGTHGYVTHIGETNPFGTSVLKP